MVVLVFEVDPDQPALQSRDPPGSPGVQHRGNLKAVLLIIVKIRENIIGNIYLFVAQVLSRNVRFALL